MRVSNWHRDFSVFLEEEEVRCFQLRAGDGIVLLSDLAAGSILLARGTSTAVLHRAPSGNPEPWTAARLRTPEELAYTRFGPTEVNWSAEGGAISASLPPVEDLVWPVYKSCAGYATPLELARDYLLRALELGREPHCPFALLQRVPSIVRNYVRKGEAQSAWDQLLADGPLFLTGRSRSSTERCLPGAGRQVT